MNILLQSKADVEAFFGQQATMETNLLDMVAQGEDAFGWLLGSMDNGFQLTIGFFNDKARYIAFAKTSGTAWDDADVRACLMVVGNFSNWSLKQGSPFFDYTERADGKPDGKIIASATGWHSPARRYAFVYVPVVPGEIALMPVQDSIDNNFPT